MNIRQAFAEQADACRRLGSPLTAVVCERLGAALHPDQGQVAQRILEWPGDAGPSADSVPLRLAGALHALILSGRSPELARAYAGSDPQTEALLAAIQTNESWVNAWLDSPPQTNEVGRSAAIIAAARFLSGLHVLPMEALELGASAGLNLNFYRYQLLPDGSGVQFDGPILQPEFQGEVPQGDFQVVHAEGVDLRPVDPVADRLRLLAYCWPDQTHRMARLRAALDMAQRHPPIVSQGSAADWLEARLARPAPGRLRFVYHTIAWQYFGTEVQMRCDRVLLEAGASASPDAPLAHFSMEGDGRSPGAALRLKLWDGRAREWASGRADFHGRWLDWSPQEVTPA